MKFEIIKHREYVKNTLQGFISVKFLDFPGGAIEIRDIAVHCRPNVGSSVKGSRWLQMPSKPYEKDGEKKWSFIIVIEPWEYWKQLQGAILKRLDEMQSKAAMNGKVYGEASDNTIPF